MAKGSKGRPPKARAKQSASKTPRAAGTASKFHERPHFSFEYVDRSSDHAWGWRFSDEDAHALLAFLCEMAKLTWHEIQQQSTPASGGRSRSKHHSQGVDSLDSAAKNYVQKWKLDETFGEDMFRFRLGGERRLWGYRRDRMFYVIWWDPDHQVYPTD